MSSPYKRRRPSLVRNFWVYRRLVGLAVIVGLMLGFIWANNTDVTVTFPFRLWTVQGKLWLVIVLSALAGSVVTALALAVFYAVRQVHMSAGGHTDDVANRLPDDRPPADYASKASEATPGRHWES